MSATKSKGNGQIIKGIVFAMAVSALLCVIYALLIERGKCSADSADIVMSAIVMLGAIIGGAISAAGSPRRLIIGLASGIIFSLLLVIIPVLAYPDSVSWLKIARIIAVAAAGGAIGSIVNLGKSNKKFHKSRKKRI